MTTDLPQGYQPTAAEPYMNPLQIEYFRRKLSALRDSLLHELTIANAPPADQNMREGDQTDQASAETERDIEVLNRARTQLLLNQADLALARIADNTYGYCEETGEPIGLKRLEVEPTATLSVEAKERQEKAGR